MCVSPEINARVNVTVATELHLGAGSPGFGQPPHTPPLPSPPVNEPDHER